MNWNGNWSPLQYDTLIIHWTWDGGLLWLNFPSFFTLSAFCMLSTRLSTVADLWFYSTPSRYKDVPPQRCRGLHQTSSINEHEEICFIFRDECETCKPNTRRQLISRITVSSTLLLFQLSIKVQDLTTVILLIKLRNTSLKWLLNVWKPQKQFNKC